MNNNNNNDGTLIPSLADLNNMADHFTSELD